MATSLQSRKIQTTFCFFSLLRRTKTSLQASKPDAIQKLCPLTDRPTDGGEVKSNSLAKKDIKDKCHSSRDLIGLLYLFSLVLVLPPSLNFTLWLKLHCTYLIWFDITNSCVNTKSNPRYLRLELAIWSLVSLICCIVMLVLYGDIPFTGVFLALLFLLDSILLVYYWVGLITLYVKKSTNFTVPAQNL